MTHVKESFLAHTHIAQIYGFVGRELKGGGVLIGRFGKVLLLKRIEISLEVTSSSYVFHWVIKLMVIN